MLVKLMLIAGGGAVGALLRFAISTWSQGLTKSDFPIGTLLVNTLGCFAIGMCAAYFSGPQLVREELRPALVIGLLGAFTTFSTFGYETFELMNEKQFTLAGLNVLLSNALGLGGVWLGYRLAMQ